MVAREKDALRAAAPSFDHRHGRAYAEKAGFIRGGRYYAALAQTADNDCLSFQFRMITLLHSGKKSVHVYMGNPSFHSFIIACCEV